MRIRFLKDYQAVVQDGGTRFFTIGEEVDATQIEQVSQARGATLFCSAREDQFTIWLQSGECLLLVNKSVFERVFTAVHDSFIGSGIGFYDSFGCGIHVSGVLMTPNSFLRRRSGGCSG